MFFDHNKPKLLGVSRMKTMPSTTKSEGGGKRIYSEEEEVEEEEEEEEDEKYDNDEQSDEGKSFDDDENKYKKKSTKKLSTKSSFLILVFCSVVFAFVMYMDQRLPAPRTISDKRRSPDEDTFFVEERARKLLRELISVGPRPAGSYENEILAVDFLKRELESIKRRSKPIHRLTIDVQKPRGSFNLGFVDGLTHHYKNIQNVIVKFESGHGSKDALLVNCHFDSVPMSPGASDDAVSCAIMLELLEALAQSDNPLRHNLIFLFNGAEENMLPGSHGFITQHMWAEDVRAFINLEACGAGGRELVFQSGPEHPWLIKAYAEVAPHPFASIIGQEVFQSGVIPADTDFRIFRDYGKIPGLDIAYMKNGYVYHTKYDTEDKIPSGSIQRAGDNVLAVIRRLANSEILSDTESYRHGTVVYFDFLGLCLIYYPEWFGIILNLIIVVISVSITYSKAMKSYQYGVTMECYIRQLGYTFMIQVSGCVASFVVVTMIAVILDAFCRPMSWYARPYLIFFLYMIPTILSVIAVFYFALPRQKKYFQFVDGVWVIESLYFEVSKLVWTFFCFVMTIFRLKSSFFCTIWVVFPTVGRLILDRLYDRTATKRKPKGYTWLLIHLFSIVIPLVFNMYLIYTTFAMFIPIMGRTGSSLNPDLLIGYKAAGMTLATISFICPLVMVMRKPTIIITTLYMMTVITLGLVLLTPLGFPYSNTPSNLAPHRSLVFHTAREFYNKAGELEKEDAGFFLINLDRNSPQILQPYVPKLIERREITETQCQKYLYCGMPMYYPVASMLRINHWIPAKSPRIYQDTSLRLLHTDEPKPHVLKLLFRINGPDHMGIYISPASGIKLKAWSFVDGEVFPGPIWKNDRPTYYIFYSHGIGPTPWEFWLEFIVPKSYTPDHDLADIAITGHIIHGNEMHTPELKTFFRQFPSWAYPVGWTASYKSFKF